MTAAARWIAAVLAALLIAGCSESDEPGLEPIDGGVARGPGFTFPLGSDWRTLEDPEKRLPEGAAALVDTIVEGGAWARPSDDEGESVLVLVAIEQAPPDTPWAVVEQTLNGLGNGNYRVEPKGDALDGADTAFISASGGPDGLVKRGVSARRGTLLYSLTVQTKDADPAELERIRDSIAQRWKWAPLTASDEERITRVTREVDGSGYRVTVPPGWRGLQGKDLPDQEALGADTVWYGSNGVTGITTVDVSHRPSPYEDLEGSLARLERAERKAFEPFTSFRRDRRLTLGGEPALAFDVTKRVEGDLWRHLAVLTIHDGTQFRIVLQGKAARHARDRRAFLAALESWRWE